MEYQEIAVERRTDGIGIIKLNRPEKRNAINIRMRHEISTCLQEWKQQSEIGVIIFTGSGSVFSAGFDLDDFKHPELYDVLLESSSMYHRDIWNFPKPTIAAINGPALGGGLDLITLCDIRICADSAVFGHPEIKFGAPPLATPMRWIVGQGITRDLCLTGRRMNAEEAYRSGLVSEVVKNSELLQRAIELAKSVLEAPKETLEYTKAFLTGNVGKGFEESFYVEHDKAFKEVLLKKAKEKFHEKQT